MSSKYTFRSKSGEVMWGNMGEFCQIPHIHHVFDLEWIFEYMLWKPLLWPSFLHPYTRFCDPIQSCYSQSKTLVPWAHLEYFVLFIPGTLCIRGKCPPLSCTLIIFWRHLLLLCHFMIPESRQFPKILISSCSYIWQWCGPLLQERLHLVLKGRWQDPKINPNRGS